MKNFKTGITAALAVAGLMAGASSVAAQGVGYIGLSFMNDAATNTNNSEDIDIKSVAIDGAYAFSFGTGSTLVFDAMALGSDFTDDDDIFDGDEMENPFQIGVHYLKDIGSNTKLGGFLAYGQAHHEGDDWNFDLAMGGAEIIYEANDRVILFGQVGYGDTSGGIDGFGFDAGGFGRAGLIYTGFGQTAITLEGEIAGSTRYEDAEEEGGFFSIALHGQTNLSSNGNWAATYGIRHARFNAADDSDSIRENTIHVGVRYLFGANKPGDLARAGIIGLPHLPLRSNVWVPSFD